MAEYIERETLFEEIRKEFRPYWQIPCDYEDRVTQKMVTKMRGLIDKLTAADVVEVVRCKDCAYYGGITFGNICRRWSALNVKNCTKPDDYCSYGKRKDGEENGL